MLADESETQVLSSINAGDLYAWVVDGEVVGIVLAIPVTEYEVELKAVAITPEHQGKGVGSAMVRSVVDALREQSVERVRVGTGNSGIGQLAFYQKLGFRLESIERDFFTPSRGYPAEIAENGIPLRDMIWMDQMLQESPSR
jgi:ribosomal protein S18 acetylase RimI-like enzyme